MKQTILSTSNPRASAFERLSETTIRSWEDIDTALDDISSPGKSATPDFSGNCRAIGFITFDYGVDGVSMEIAKYATCLERLYRRQGTGPVIHCIGGGFTESADNVLASHWRRHELRGANGWKKWKGGRWFGALFHQDMPEGSDRSAEIAAEIWRQAIEHTGWLVRKVVEENVEILVPVNVNSNPGNPSLALAVVLASELTGVVVLNSNHDFFWESGKPASARQKGEPAGPRDHFFHNHENRSFFRFLTRIFPWNGDRWLQLVINSHQARVLLTEYGFDESRVMELGTFVDDDFFAPCPRTKRAELRLRLGQILAGGERLIAVRPIELFRARASAWMHDQHPIVCGSEPGLSLDLTNPNALWLLQPTRVVTRKRIERDWELIGALFRYPPFRAMFEEKADLTLTLHVTGPVPVEHQADLDRILETYAAVVHSLPPFIQRRVYQTFSAGKLGHSAVQRRDLSNLTVSELYHVSDLVLLPSRTEGRGLPILESAAAGIPLVCSQYEPREVFAKVVGEALSPDLQIHYSRFPEGRFETALLQEITDILFLPELTGGRRLHNRRAVAARFSLRNLSHTFERALKRLAGSDG
jgi:glycosyltransferase involved in cell wall biosynthesis